MDLKKENGQPKYAGMRYFYFNWNPTAEASEISNHLIIAEDAQTATNVFMKTFGNLKKNNINYIQEVSIDETPVGEPIVPEPQEEDPVKAKIHKNLRTMMGFRHYKR